MKKGRNKGGRGKGRKERVKVEKRKRKKRRREALVRLSFLNPFCFTEITIKTKGFQSERLQSADNS